jgi:hypothetical protein
MSGELTKIRHRFSYDETRFIMGMHSIGATARQIATALVVNGFQERRINLIHKHIRREKGKEASEAVNRHGIRTPFSG